MEYFYHFPIDLNNPAFLHYLLQARENSQFAELGVKLMKGGMSGLFDTWMLQESDLVQVMHFM